jgi:hypothetical protein
VSSILHAFDSMCLAPNGRDQRARAIDSTQVKPADRGLRLHRFVLSFIVDEID